MSEFMTETVGAIAACGPGARVAVVQFSNDCRVEVEPAALSQDEFAERMTGVVSRYPTACWPGCPLHILPAGAHWLPTSPPSPFLPQNRINGGTNISLAIQKAGQLLKPLSVDTERVVVLLTDGRIDSHQVRSGPCALSPDPPFHSWS